MKLRFELRELLGAVTILAFVLALFVYLPAGDAATLAFLFALAVPLSYKTSARLEALFWCLAAAKICYHLGLLLSVHHQPLLAYALTCVCWVATIGYGLRRQSRLRNRMGIVGLAGMFTAFMVVRDRWGGDQWLIDMERSHWSGIAVLTAIAGCLPIFGSSRNHET